MNKHLLEEKHRLVEKLGVIIENNNKLAPVASRIISYVVLTGKSGVTFDDLVINLCASKSTISTHLNHLVDLKQLEYFTKQGDRKKYYIISQCHILTHMDNIINSWNSEKELHLEMKSYKEKMNDVTADDAEKFNLEFHNNYITFLDETMNLVTVLKEKIINNQSN
ncbi:transcriptional regulator [Formosa sp. PL04]|uniref:GbsR/MarR family transcriptional regulator n=1 Tax=Formosa sp. PL04 TaxID=3081755 RepID=UPI002980BCDA|nr:transcriptional regulator [Formosa sp. PL04]MDW5290649.1 transcriptional regulator [Formosa sp. PL04]